MLKAVAQAGGGIKAVVYVAPRPWAKSRWVPGAPLQLHAKVVSFAAKRLSRQVFYSFNLVN
jgi:hypothetical protein